MEFYEVLKTRRSIRGYKPDAVAENVLNRIAEAVNLAPTACNRQPFKLLLVRDPAMKKTICANCKFEFLAQAPVIAVMMTNESAAWTRFEGNSAADIDASIAMEHFVLAAAGIVYAAIYLLFTIALRLDEVQILTRRFRRKGA